MWPVNPWKPTRGLSGLSSPAQFPPEPCSALPSPAIHEMLHLTSVSLSLSFLNIYLFGHARMWHAGSLAVACKLLVAACGIGINSGLPALGVQTLSHWTTCKVPYLHVFAPHVPAASVSFLGQSLHSFQSLLPRKILLDPPPPVHLG